jgi:hypothetical protein
MNLPRSMEFMEIVRHITFIFRMFMCRLSARLTSNGGEPDKVLLRIYVLTSPSISSLGCRVHYKIAIFSSHFRARERFYSFSHILQTETCTRAYLKFLNLLM